VILAANIAMMVAGAVKEGVTLDEPSHVHRLQGFLSTGWYVGVNHVENGHVTQEGGYAYAPVVALVGHALGALLGTEEWQTVSETPGAYVVRHLVVVSFGVLGLLAAAATTRLLTRSWRWGVVAAAILGSIPVYIGHSMYNVKDAPVAAGYTVVTLGAVALTRPSIRTRRMQVLAIGALALGIWIAAGVRPAMLVAIAASVTLALAASLMRLRRNDTEGRRRMIARLVTAAAGSIAGYLALVLTYHKLFLRPELLYEGVLKSGEFPWHGYTLTAGKFLPAEHASSSYLPLWFAAQTPVLVSILCLGAIAWFVRGAMLVSARRRGDGDLLVGVAVVLVQALFLPWVAMAGGSTLYQGARQMLFVVPAMALLAAVGAWLFARRAAMPDRMRAGPALLAALVAVLAITTASSAALFPYAYTWFNAATAIRPIDGNWAADFEWQSSREVLPKVDTLDGGRCVLLQPHTNCNRDQVAPFRDSLGDDLAGPPLAPGEVWRLAYGGPATRPDAPSVDHNLVHDCRRVDAVTRQLFWRTVTMSTVERCRR
jgi:hypothetical protein